jgi:hypothetical protein
MMEYECVGGPLCGSKMPVRTKWTRRYEHHGQWHYYQLCSVGKVKYWHYAGTRPNKGMRPVLVPYGLLARSNR